MLGCWGAGVPVLLLGWQGCAGGAGGGRRRGAGRLKEPCRAGRPPQAGPPQRCTRAAPPRRLGSLRVELDADLRFRRYEFAASTYEQLVAHRMMFADLKLSLGEAEERAANVEAALAAGAAPDPRALLQLARNVTGVRRGAGLGWAGLGCSLPLGCALRGAAPLARAGPGLGPEARAPCCPPGRGGLRCHVPACTDPRWPAVAPRRPAGAAQLPRGAGAGHPRRVGPLQEHAALCLYDGHRCRAGGPHAPGFSEERLAAVCVQQVWPHAAARAHDGAAGGGAAAGAAGAGAGAPRAANAAAWAAAGAAGAGRVPARTPAATAAAAAAAAAARAA